MKAYRPGFGRGLASFMSALFWTPVIAGMGMTLLHFMILMNRLENPRNRLSPEGAQLLLVGGASIVALIGGLSALAGLLGHRRSRYTVGATDLQVETGIVWRRSRTLSLAEITRIELSSGPLMRLLGLRDLRVFSGNGPQAPSVTLHGLRGAEEIQRFLLDRRDAVREAMLAGDPVPGRTPQDVVLHRLAAAVERLEARMPRT